MSRTTSAGASHWLRFLGCQGAFSTLGGYGTYTVTAGGAWTYTLDNTLAATQALKEGRVRSPRVQLEFAAVPTPSSAFKRVVREAAFDVAEDFADFQAATSAADHSTAARYDQRFDRCEPTDLTNGPDAN